MPFASTTRPPPTSDQTDKSVGLGITAAAAPGRTTPHTGGAAVLIGRDAGW
jgi:hypothetical protein